MNSTCSNHYDISPSLRHEVDETEENIKSRQKGRTPVYLVIEESNQVTQVEMVKGECSMSCEMARRYPYW